MLTIERVHTTEQFAAMRDEWNALLRQSHSNCVFLTHEWLFTWWKHLAGHRKLYIVTVRDAGRLIGVLPACLRNPQYTRMIPRIVEFLGSGVIGSDYLDIVAEAGREDDVLDGIAHQLASTGLMLQFGQLRRGSCLTSRLADALGQRKWSVAGVKTNVCPFIPLEGETWDTYLATLGSSQRYNFLRRLRNFEKSDGFRFERETPLSVIIDLHKKRWGASAGLSEAFQTPQIVAFHREFTGLARKLGWLRLLSIWSGDQPAAALYGLTYARVFYFYQSGFDLAFAKQSAGLVMMGLGIRSAIEEHAAEYDLLHGDEEYKFHWASSTRELGRIEMYPPHVGGKLYQHCISFNRTARRMVRRMLVRA
jgi:CelD/BcsL family acetyltransferase involved in cellulose biosynthesis